MVQSVLQALKQLTVLSQLQLGDPIHFRPKTPEPIRRNVEQVPKRDTADDWLFETPHSPLSPFVRAMSGELDRVSASLGSLRELLDSMSRLVPEPATPLVNAVSSFSPVEADEFLFERAPLPALISEALPREGDAVFLFEESDIPVHISVLDCPLQEKRAA